MVCAVAIPCQARERDSSILSILTQSSQIIQYIRFTFLYQAVNHFAEQGVNPGEPGAGELLWIVFVE